MIRARHLGLAATYLAHRWRALHVFEAQCALLNACNLRCAYCTCPEIPTDLLTTEQWLDIVSRLAAVGTRRIKWQGGEPTLRPDFEELCRGCRRHGVRVAVVTNGSRIARQPALLEALDEVVVSIDSASSEVHDRYRGQGSHAVAVAAVRLARARDLPTYVVMVAHRDSVGGLGEMLRFCEREGVRLNVNPIVFGRAAYDDRARYLALEQEQEAQLHHDLARLKGEGRPLLFSAAAYERSANWPDYDQLTVPSEGPSRCMAGRFYVHINPNGDVEPCGQHGASLRPRNIVRDGFEAAIAHVQRHDCGDCFSAYLNERKELFALRPAAIASLLGRG